LYTLRTQHDHLLITSLQAQTDPNDEHVVTRHLQAPYKKPLRPQEI